MARAIPETLQKLRDLKKLLRDLRPHLSALAATDDDPEFKKLLKRVDKELK
jgi:hypothetical protein